MQYDCFEFLFKNFITFSPYFSKAFNVKFKSLSFWSALPGSTTDSRYTRGGTWKPSAINQEIFIFWFLFEEVQDDSSSIFLWLRVAWCVRFASARASAIILLFICFEGCGSGTYISVLQSIPVFVFSIFNVDDFEVCAIAFLVCLWSILVRSLDLEVKLRVSGATFKVTQVDHNFHVVCLVIAHQTATSF